MAEGPGGGWPDVPDTAAGGIVRLDSIDLDPPIVDVSAGTHLA